MKTKRNWIPVSILCVFSLLAVMSVLAYAADTGFSGKWKGEIVAGGPVGGLGGPAAPVSQFVQGRGGGGARGGGGIAGLGGRAPQKVTLNLKTKDKDTKASGNITIGEATEDVREGTIEGAKVMFRTGKAPATVYEYTGELKGDELLMERWISGGRGAVTKFTLKRD